MRKRNPMARDLRVNPLYRSRKGKSRRDLEQRADRWSRELSLFLIRYCLIGPSDSPDIDNLEGNPAFSNAK